MNPAVDNPAKLIEPAADALFGGGISEIGLLLSLLLVLLGQLLVLLRRVRSRIGFEERWSLGRFARPLRSVGGAGLFLVLVQGVGASLSAPWAIGVLLLLVGALGFSGTLQNAMSGLHLQLRLRLREGDRIRVGERRGELQGLHWDHVELVDEDGRSLYLPNRLLTREGVEVHPLRHAVPLTLRLPAEGVELSALRDAVAISPYRIAGTPMSVRKHGDGVEVRCMTWSAEACRAARAALQVPPEVPK